MGWLAHEPHGDLWSVVLTQPVVVGESLKDAKGRMAPKQRAFMRWLDRIGMTAAMTTTHIVWSKRSGGWHYHTHVLADVPRGLTSEQGLWEKWVEVSDGECCADANGAVRQVLGAGDPIEALREDGGDPEFWRESRSETARAVQYPMRDLAQGVSSWRLGGDPSRVEAAAEELVVTAAGWKLFRAWGAWRKPCPKAAAADAAKKTHDLAQGDAERGPAAPAAKKEPLGTVRQVWFAAKRGEGWARAAMQDFERTVSNSSEFARRFVMYCRLAWAGDGGT